MNRRYLTSAAAVALSFAVATPVLAQGHRSGGQARGEGQAQGGRPTPGPSAAPRTQAPTGQPRAEQRQAQPRFVTPPAVQQRQEQPRFVQPQQPQQGFNQSDRRFNQSDRRFTQPDQRFNGPDQRFDQRRFSGSQPRYVQPQRFATPRFQERRFISPRVIRPGGGFYRSYSRPYYTFRPRFSLGFGIWAGYPILYSVYGSSFYPYPYPATVYPVPVPGSVAPVATGGLSFDIDPPDAEIYVDGQAIGEVDQFAPDEQPLTLTTGRHRVEIVAPGFRTLSFDVDIVPGQVIPYQGAMQPL